jgi:uridine kinase
VSSPLVLGIAGGSGSGKTTVANEIQKALGAHCVRVDHDSYYRDQSHLSPEERAAINFDHPDALDNLLMAEHVADLKSGRGIEKPIYDFKTHSRVVETTRLEPAPIILVEGILVLAIEALRSTFDIKIYVDTDADIRLMRRIRRDLEQRGRSFADVRKQYYETVRPMHLAFVEPSKRYADLIVPEGGQNRIAIEMILARVRMYLAEGR